jgi:hypothetical protein
LALAIPNMLHSLGRNFIVVRRGTYSYELTGGTVGLIELVPAGLYPRALKIFCVRLSLSFTLRSCGFIHSLVSSYTSFFNILFELWRCGVNMDVGEASRPLPGFYIV